MNIDTNTSLNELLELWGKYTHNIFKNGIKSAKDIEEGRNIKKLLDTKGVQHVEIGGVTESTLTVRYRIGYKWNTQEVAITN